MYALLGTSKALKFDRLVRKFKNKRAMANDFDQNICEVANNLGEVVGRGTLGIVYSFKKTPGMVVKEICLDMLDEAARNILAQKLSVYQHVKHPRIIEYSWALIDDHFVYLSMCRYHETLTSMIIRHKRERRPISEDVIFHVIKDVASALSYLHEPNKPGVNGELLPVLLHQNLKTDNILTNEDSSTFVIADYGVCRDILEETPTVTVSSIYSAPEVLMRKEYSTASDMWSFGVVLYELATLSRPNFRGGCSPAEVFVEGWEPDLTAIRDDFLKKIIARLLVLDPGNRLSAKGLENVLSIRTKVENAPSIPQSDYNPVLKFETHPVQHTHQEMLTLNTPQIKPENQTRPVAPSQIPRVPSQSAVRSQGIESKSESIIPDSPSSGPQRVDPSSPLIKPILHEDPINPTKLILAACRNDLVSVKEGIVFGNEVGRRDAHGMTALMHAAIRGHVQVVRALLNKESGLKDEQGMTALMHAVRSGNVEVIDILSRREKGATDKNGRTALSIALDHHNLSVIKRLAKAEKDVLKWSYLMYAAATGNINTAKKHLDSKHKKDVNGDTALIIAARAGFFNIVDLIQPTTPKGVTALMRAAKNGDIKTVRALISNQNKYQTTESHTYMSGSKKYLCPKGYTALMFAARQGNLEVINELINYESGMQTANGETALMQAVQERNIEAVKLLVEYEKGMVASSASGTSQIEYTALDIARREGYQEIVDLLSRHPEEWH